MAQVYYDNHHTRLDPPAIGQLPLRPLREKLYDQRTQRLVPFLGAGASLQARLPHALTAPAQRPSGAALAQVCSSVNITDPLAMRFVEIAIQFAQLIEQRSVLIEQEEEQYAPSSWELAKRLAEVLTLRPLRPLGNKLKTLLDEPIDRGDYVDMITCVADVMGLSQSVPQLLTVASYFNEDQLREMMRDNLLDRIRRVTSVTKTQNMVAAAARRFVNAQMSSNSEYKRDYLIITTNYDQLIERRLQELGVPTIVLTVDAGNQVVTKPMPDYDTLRQTLNVSDADWQELCRVYGVKPPGNAAQPGRFGYVAPLSAINFVERTDKRHSLVVVYKIHGCPVTYNALRAVQNGAERSDDNRVHDPDESREDWDSIVISDQDYVRFIQKNELNIPNYVRTRAQMGGLMFLGYSFADWNVRTLYEELVLSRYANEEARRRTPDELRNRDYVVLRSYEDTDAYFFRPWDVSVLVTDLNDLVDALEAP